MSVAGIALDASSRSPIVLLRDPSRSRQVPIWIDQAQAHNIMAGLNDSPQPRPLSHDLMAALLDAGGLQLERVIIHAIEDSTFRAVLRLCDSDHDTTTAETDELEAALDADDSARCHWDRYVHCSTGLGLGSQTLGADTNATDHANTQSLEHALPGLPTRV